MSPRTWQEWLPFPPAGWNYSLALVAQGRVNTFALTNPTLTPNGFSVSVPTQNGKAYSLEYKNSLSDANWIAPTPVNGTGGLLNLTDQSSARTARFYRVVEE